MVRQDVEDAKNRFAPQLLSQGNPCVLAVKADTRKGVDIIVVYVDKGDYTKIPREYDGVPVLLQYVGDR